MAPRSATATLVADAPISGVVVPLVSRSTVGERPEPSPRALLEALARREGLRGRKALDAAFVLWTLEIAAEPSPGGRRWGRAASIKRAGAMMVKAARVLGAMQEAGDT